MIFSFARQHPILTYWMGGIETWLTTVIPMWIFKPEWIELIAAKAEIGFETLKECATELLSMGWPS